MIYFITIRLRDQVYAQAQGFTKMLSLYGWGDDASTAKSNVTAYCIGAGLKPAEILSASLSQKQDLSEFTFIEQIYGVPQDLAEAAIRGKGMPGDIVQKSLAKLQHNMADVQRGLTMMDMEETEAGPAVMRP